MRFVGKLLLDSQSEEAIRRYVSDNSKLVVRPKNEFHSTVFYAEETPIIESGSVVGKVRRRLPVQLDPRTFCFDVFGDYYLALRYSSESVEGIKCLLAEEAVRQMITVWPNVEDEGDVAVLQASMPRRMTQVFDSSLHISLARNFCGSTGNLPPFSEPLTLVDFVYHSK